MHRSTFLPTLSPLLLLSFGASFVQSFALPRSSSGSFSIPQHDGNSSRSLGIALKQVTFTYGPAVAGGPFYPSGVDGLADDTSDQALEQLELAPELALSALDAAKFTLDAPLFHGFKTLKDYSDSYTNEWQNTLPAGPAAGILSNYTQDLLFSMERLSNSPYAIRRLKSTDTIQFTIEDNVAKSISGTTLQGLLASGRLFYADYRDQGSLPKTAQFGAACDGYFYINETSNDFLPLAIRTNVGSNLIYTPLDDNVHDPDHSDWLLAKIMFNVNDFWFAQTNHLASTHEVVQIAYMAAVRTLSESHPVLALLHRLTYEVFAIQPLAATLLFTPGLVFDQLLAHTGQAAQSYTTNRYQNLGSGRFHANYFVTELENRGLLNTAAIGSGPELKSFPFYADAKVIHDAISKFISSFVDSYYAADTDVNGDVEIQAWVKEAQGPAEAIDFPAIATKSALVDVLTHVAHLVSTSHHTVNANELLSVSSVLPFHPSALYAEPPTTKGNITVANYLPPLLKIVEQSTFAALFARPTFVGTNRTLLHMFDDPATVGRMNSQTISAASVFKSEMQAFSAVVSTRVFDSAGRSQGMPFVWKMLDPNVAPFSLTI